MISKILNIPESYKLLNEINFIRHEKKYLFGVHVSFKIFFFRYLISNFITFDN